MRFVSVVLAFILLAGCMASGTKFSEITDIPAVSPDKSRVYVYREYVYKGSGLATPILDNGVKVGELNVGGYFTYETDSGFHEIRTDTYVVDEPAILEMQSGATYYVSITQEGLWRFVFISSQMSQLDALPALAEMRNQGT
ncbi:MAG: DUF2846 domain-containing protein [Sneathiella sp.]|uniref:DUF2846 domain-containing protein n=1 Tax=Sneathiella sp. TaxID=1964365 RepID=UPI0030019130